MQGFTLNFLLIIELFLDLFLGRECKGLHLLSCLLSSYSQTYFQVQNARVYPYFLCHFLAILRLISRSRMQGFSHTFFLIIKLFLDLFLGRECKGLPLISYLLSSYSQTYFQVENARVYTYFLAYYRAILRLIYRSRMQGFTLTILLIIEPLLEVFIGLECKGLPFLFGSLSSYSQTYLQVQNANSLPLLFGSLSSYSQTYFQVQNASVYPYFFANYPAILRLISRSRMQGFTLTFSLIIQLFLDYSQTRVISRCRMQGFTLTFCVIIKLFLDLFLGLECKSLPLLFCSLSSYTQTYFQVQNASVYPYFFANAILRLISRKGLPLLFRSLSSYSQVQGFTLTFCVIIKLFLDLFLGLECKSLPLLFCSLSSYTQTCFQVQNANDYPYFFAYYQAIL